MPAHKAIPLIHVNSAVETVRVPGSPDDVRSFRLAAIATALRRSRMFADLPSEDLQTVASGCTTRMLRKGELLFREGEKAEGFYVVQTGAINVYRLTPDGREQIICVFRAPESFAEVTLATSDTYPANAVALEPSHVIVVQKAPFRELIRRQPELSLRMLASMSVHLKHLVQSLHDIKGRQIEFRLADWLLRQCTTAADQDPVVFTLPMTKKTLAGQLGVTSETLSRTFARFRAEGLIRVDGATVHLLNLAGLRAYVDN